MLTFDSWTGINNVLPAHRLGGSDLIGAQDVNIGLTGEITRRAGFTEVSTDCHKNLHQAAGYRLATQGSELVALHPNGDRYVIHPSLGPERVWYCNLPDGRVTFANGLIQGITDGFSGQDRSIPAPDSLGAPDMAFGDLDPGQYRYALTHVRADGAESPALVSEPITITQGGLRLDGLPVRLGLGINIYLTQRDGEQPYLVGTTVGSSFEWAGKNSDLVLPCRTVGAQAIPVGTITAYWRGRVLVAQGGLLLASRDYAPHVSDWRDFKQFGGTITAIQPVDDGVYVGTTEDLIWLGGPSWDALTYTATRRGPVVLGSGVTAPGDRLKLGDGVGGGSAMVCISGGEIVAGFNGGTISGLTTDRYKTTATEVCATFREVDGIPQYIACSQ